MKYETAIIDGKTVAADLRNSLKEEVEKLPAQPGLAVILVGDDPASHVYVGNKVKACEAVGIKSFESRLPAQATQAEVAAEIAAFNDNPQVHGILLQLPVPDHLDSDALVQSIAPSKDVDGLSFINQGKLIAGDKTGLVPCTPQGSLRLIKTVKEDLSGLHAVVIGRSLLFGKPMAQLLLSENCTVTQAHSKTKNLPEICKQADILVAAVGRPLMVKGEWIKPGAIVIDVGINRLESTNGGGKLVGDVDFEAAQGIASAITPVPGGVGPMTIACLLANTIAASQAA
ncbi:MAG: bifunctional methylenetetrahydrofolate dehydrogenase/methenyltetrahydrofolate cyclohydrolase FolD [Alphaproteobacteria bacterium]|nr:bifunctional methylenetetrahydrofolate dehydrogenase/methenyltetrahydrofolate cyclohydrolase FolD [Alphaproteobacteria bacterium]MCD8570048.1 bifunctional methylenetetrahydrofolate dehydrogenase/methenyltetrahydrofolate cyclohydrolase FolD [Alphaproteobacteria bacterium]